MKPVHVDQLNPQSHDIYSWVIRYYFCLQVKQWEFTSEAHIREVAYSLWRNGMDVQYSGKFSRGPNFRNFRDPQPRRKNKSRENLNSWNFVLMKIFTRAFCALVLLLDDGTASLFQTIRRRPTLSHGTSFILCEPSDDKSLCRKRRPLSKINIRGISSPACIRSSE